MRRRHLESVSAAPYGSTFQHLLKSPIRIQPQLKRKGVLGHSPKCVLVWGPRRDARPAGERRSGGALEGCLSHRDSDPTWSKARDDAYAQKERHGGEPCNLCLCKSPHPLYPTIKTPPEAFVAPGGKLDACFIVLGYPFSSTASRCPTPAHKYPPCAGCSERFPGRSHRTDPHPLPPRRR